MLQWVSADLRTGRLLGDLPGVTVDQSLRRSISNYDTASVTVALAGAGAEWERATLPGASVLACYDDADNTGNTLGPIQWAGFVNGRKRTVGTGQLSLPLVTAEGYLDRRDVGDVSWAAALHRDDLIGWIFTKYVAESSTEPGLPLQLSYTQFGGPTIGNLTVWQNTDNATVLTRLNQVCARWGGEFTIEWMWSADQTSIYPVASWGDRVGVATKAGLTPPVIFSMPGVVASADCTEDYSGGAGATKIVAYSSGNGTVTPYAPPVYTGDPVRPTFEYRYSPSNTEPDTTVLQAYAKGAAAILGPGAQALALTLSTDPAATKTRRLGVDWRLGDDVVCDIAPCDEFPSGYSRTGRVIAYERTDTTVTPTFADPAVYVAPQ